LYQGTTDALYQGTTLVGPQRPNKNPGFSPWAVFFGPEFSPDDVFQAGSAPAGAEAQFPFSFFTARLKVVPRYKTKIPGSFTPNSCVEVY
jgi:hypothetical protein